MYDSIRDLKYALRRSVLLKPLPFHEPGRLIGVWQTAPGVNIKDLNASIADYVTYREDSSAFADVAIWNGRSVTVTEFADPERVDGIGIYAVISYTVAQRTREIGIRMALGAQQGELKRMFVGRGLLWSGIGAAAGCAAAAALSRLMSALLFEISPLDPLTYAVAAVGILAAAAVASYLPARRVTRVDPVEALRTE